MILVTGATGLVGSHLLWKLLQENERVVAIMRYTSNLQPLRAVFATYTQEPDRFLSRIDWRVAAINDYTALENALVGVTEVFHCAAIVSLGGSSATIMDVNVTGTKNLVELCLRHKVKGFYYVSSIAACGSNTFGERVTEDSPWKETEQKSMYALTKYSAEQEVWKAIQQGLPAVIVNPGVILGFSGVNSGSSMLFYRVKKGLPFYIDGGSGYVGVKDVVRAMLLLRKKGIVGKRFILVSENNSNREVLGMIANGFGKRPPLIKVSLYFLIAAASLMAIAGKIFGFNPALNAASARTSTKRSFYSSEAIRENLHMEFTPMQVVIREVCECIIQQKAGDSIRH